MKMEVDEKALIAAFRAHDAEEAYQMGEPDPWECGVPEPYLHDRLAAMRAGIEAYIKWVSPDFNEKEIK